MDSGIAYNAPRRNIVFNSLDYYLENNKTLSYLEADELYAKNTDMPLTYDEMIQHFDDDFNITFASANPAASTINSTSNNFYILPFDNTKTTFINETSTIIGNDMITPAAISPLFIGDLVGNATTSTTSNFSNTITGSTQTSITQMQNIATLYSGNITLTSDTLNISNKLLFWTNTILPPNLPSTLNCNKLTLPNGVGVKDDVQFFDPNEPFSLEYGSKKAFKTWLRPFNPYTSPTQQVKPHLECKYEYNVSNEKVQSVCDLRHTISSYHGLVNRENYRTGGRWDFLYRKLANGMYLYASTNTNFKTIVSMTVPTVSGTVFEPEFQLGNAFSAVNLELDSGVSFSVSGTKSFTINHPTEENHYIRHSCVESPRYDNVYRDQITLVDGYAEINIDKHFNMIDGTFLALNREFSIYTSNQTSFTRLKSSLEGNVLKITAKEPTADVISFMVIGERKDKEVMDIATSDVNGKLILERVK